MISIIIFNKTLIYKDQESATTTTVQAEQDFLGNVYNYDYDAVGNMVSNVKLDNRGNSLDVRTYSYDGLSRLKGSTINGVNHSYSYDSNNNITKKDGIGYLYNPNNSDQLIGRTDGTKILYANDPLKPSQISMPNKTH